MSADTFTEPFAELVCDARGAANAPVLSGTAPEPAVTLPVGKRRGMPRLD
jgi:hypothetical protein